MKNKLSASLLVVALMSFATAYANDADQDEQDVVISNEMTVEEQESLMMECNQIAADAGIEGNEHDEFVAECMGIYDVAVGETGDGQDQGDIPVYDEDDMSDSQSDQSENDVPVYVEES